VKKMDSMKYDEITNEIIGAFYKVYNTLGYGFLERVYQNALCIELGKIGLDAEQQKKISVYYDGISVGDYCCDIIVNDVVICELKTQESLQDANEHQLVNYLKATSIEVGLLLNFGKKPQVKRKIFDNSRKSWLTTNIYRQV
jgi:GxxExxY protein